MFSPLLICGASIYILRLMTLGRLWRLPLKHGPHQFIGVSVGPEFYREAGAKLLRGYRSSLFIPVLFDAPLALWLAYTWRHAWFCFEQFVAWIAGIIIFNLIIAHFSSKVMSMTGPAEQPANRTMQLSLAPRRLRDYTTVWIEVVIGIALATALIMLAWLYEVQGSTSETRAALRVTVWTLYLQTGLFLLKGVFVRWRMPLPSQRTEDFKRWRAAWLSYHVRVFDSVRMLFSFFLILGIIIKSHWHVWTDAAIITGICVAGPVLAVYLGYLIREQRRLTRVEREIRPVELIKEFPRRPVPEGRFVAGGLLYFNPDNPGVVVRSPQGIAINLARPGAYIWLAYLAGLAGLMLWVTR